MNWNTLDEPDTYPLRAADEVQHVENDTPTLYGIADNLRPWKVITGLESETGDDQPDPQITPTGSVKELVIRQLSLEWPYRLDMRWYRRRGVTLSVPMRAWPPPAPESVDRIRATATDAPRGASRTPSATPALPDLAQAWGGIRERSILRRGGKASVTIIAASVLLMLIAEGLGLAGIYLGLAVFSAANYAAYRIGEPNIIIGPRIALMGIYGFLGLALTVVIAA
jgi:hypothetical protein